MKNQRMLTFSVCFFLPSTSIDNSFCEIGGLEQCCRLTHLSLAHNKITKISGLDSLPLTHLCLVSWLFVVISRNINLRMKSSAVLCFQIFFLYKPVSQFCCVHKVCVFSMCLICMSLFITTFLDSIRSWPLIQKLTYGPTAGRFFSSYSQSFCLHVCLYSHVFVLSFYQPSLTVSSYQSCSICLRLYAFTFGSSCSCWSEPGSNPACIQLILSLTPLLRIPSSPPLKTAWRCQPAHHSIDPVLPGTGAVTRPC